MTTKQVIGDATLYLGDCAEILPTLPAADVCVTDPPYGLGKRLNGGSWGNCGDWDSAAPDLMAVLLSATESAIWGGNYFPLPCSRGWLVWFKRDSVPSAASVELCWTSKDMNARLIDQSIGATNAERVGHPTQKPLAVMRWTLSFFPSAQTVIDPFMGSGTTGVAAVEQGKRFIGIERDPRYFDMACKRIEQAYAQRPLFDSEPARKPEQLEIT